MNQDQHYIYVDDNKQAQEAIDYLSKFTRLGYDVETTGLKIIGKQDRLLLMQLGTEDVAYLFDPRKMDGNLLRPILENPEILKIGHNLKFDYQATRIEFGIQLDGMFDTMLSYRLLTSGLVENGEGGFVPNGIVNKNKKQFPYKGLAFLAKKFLGISLDKSVRSSFSDNQYNREFTSKQLQYAADDVLILHPLCDILSDMLQAEGLIDTALLEFEFLRPVSEMEINGVIIDKEHWRKIIYDAHCQADSVAAEIVAILEPFQEQNTLFGTSTVNISSKDQLLDAFSKLGFDLENTEEKTLKKIDHPLSKLLLQWRGYDKLISTYGEPILRKINRETDRLHFTLQQLGTHTGRLSSEKPNIQNIPQDKEDEEVKVSFRECFRASEGNKILTADYSQCIPVDELICNQYGLLSMSKCQSKDIRVPSLHSKSSQNISTYLPKGNKEVIRLTTKDGFSFSSTSDHKIKTILGWKAAGSLNSSDNLILSRDWLEPNSNLSNIDTSFCEMLGYWVGNGSFSQAGVQFAKGEDKYADIYDKLCLISKECFGKELKNYDGTFSWDLIGRDIKKEFERWGCDRSNALDKQIPYLVLQSGRLGISAFLRGLFEADGWVTATDKNTMVAFSTRSEVLSRQVQILLLGLGIFSKRKGYNEVTYINGKKYSGVQFRVSICDEFNISLFESEVGFMSFSKRNTLKNRRLNRAYSKSDTVFLEPEHLAFSQVSSCKSEGLKEVADLTVPTEHAFSVGGIFVHNCELRILAEVSNDKRFVEIFERGGDLHIITAQEVFGFSDSDLEIYKAVKRKDHPDANLLDFFTKDNISIYNTVSDFRNKTKVINFGIAYGLSSWSLAERFKVPIEEAEGILNNYFNTYHGIKRWLDRNGHESIALRYSKTIIGRKRYYTLADPTDDQIFRKSKNATRRAGNNAVIQGTNADITKEALNQLQRAYDNIDGAKLLFTVHDEIVSEVPCDKVEEVAEIKAEIMAQAFHRFVKTVPVGKDDKVGVTIADHWTK